MFDNFMKDNELRYNRELWDEYLRFEIIYGNLVSINKVVKRRFIIIIFISLLH